MATFKLGDQTFDIIDSEEIKPLAVDIFTECRFNGHHVCLAFAAVTKDGENAPVARIASRLRISLATVVDLRNPFDDILKQQMPGKEKAN